MIGYKDAEMKAVVNNTIGILCVKKNQRLIFQEGFLDVTAS